MQQLKEFLKLNLLSSSGSKAVLEERVQKYKTQGWQIHPIKSTELFPSDDEVEGSGLYILNRLTTSSSARNSVKIAGYDLDNTIIQSNNGYGNFCETEDDWHVIHDMQQDITNKRAEGYIIIIFTNQASTKKRDITLSRISNVATALGNDLLVLVATKRNMYRKPNIGMWNVMCSILNCEVTLFIYKGDNDVDDRGFAQNVSNETKIDVDFTLIKNEETSDKDEKDMSDMSDILTDNERIIIMQGMPASGKSTFATKLRDALLAKGQNVVIASNDIHGKKTLNVAKDALKNGNIVIIDNTHATRTQRAPFIAMGREMNHHILGIHINTPRGICEVRNAGRVNKVSRIVYNIYVGKFEEMSYDEGFDRILTI